MRQWGGRCDCDDRVGRDVCTVYDARSRDMGKEFFHVYGVRDGEEAEFPVRWDQGGGSGDQN